MHLCSRTAFRLTEKWTSGRENGARIYIFPRRYAFLGGDSFLLSSGCGIKIILHGVYEFTSEIGIKRRSSVDCFYFVAGAEHIFVFV